MENSPVVAHLHAPITFDEALAILPENIQITSAGKTLDGEPAYRLVTFTAYHRRDPRGLGSVAPDEVGEPVDCGPSAGPRGHHP
jgi:hypothetical protein